jgi:hypothetical protein
VREEGGRIRGKGGNLADDLATMAVLVSTGKLLLGFGCFALIVLAATFATCAACVSSAIKDGRERAAEQPTNPDEVSIDVAVNAWHECTQSVLARLKAPSTAEFLDEDRAYHHVFLKKKPKPKSKKAAELAARVAREFGFTDYIVQGEVDAQNGFGAKIRSSFECAVTRTKDNRYMVMSTHVSSR